MTDDILIGYVASDRVCSRPEGIMLGITGREIFVYLELLFVSIFFFGLLLCFLTPSWRFPP